MKGSGMKTLATHLPRWAALVLLAFALTGCASNALYKWGNYEDQLYAAYKDPTKVQALRLQLENHVEQASKSGLKVAPGLYAELGTLYLQAGQRSQAMAYYLREKQTWPESEQLMSAMIQNLERLEQGQGAKP